MGMCRLLCYNMLLPLNRLTPVTCYSRYNALLHGLTAYEMRCTRTPMIRSNRYHHSWATAQRQF